MERRFSSRRSILVLTAAGAVLGALMLWRHERVIPAPDGPSAEEILRRTAAAYAALETYRDSGTVRTRYWGGFYFFVDELRFTTAFVRPGRLRFEYRQPYRWGVERRYLIWADGDDVRSWWDVTEQLEKDQSLAAATAAASGVSSGASSRVPSLLLPDAIPRKRKFSITEPERLADRGLGGRACYRIRGGYGEDGTAVLWIDRQSHLIRRVDERLKLANERFELADEVPVELGDRPAVPTEIDFDRPTDVLSLWRLQAKAAWRALLERADLDKTRVRETTIYYPVAGEEIADELLVFDPPV